MSIRWLPVTSVQLYRGQFSNLGLIDVGGNATGRQALKVDEFTTGRPVPCLWLILGSFELIDYPTTTYPSVVEVHQLSFKVHVFDAVKPYIVSVYMENGAPFPDGLTVHRYQEYDVT